MGLVGESSRASRRLVETNEGLVDDYERGRESLCVW